jgi:CheY-like chemotaxis protein
LIIEDEEILREKLANILEVHSESTIFQIRDGEEGVEILIQTAPDLEICNVNMHKMDGFKVLEMLETLIPASEFTPFIFLSAKTEPQSILKGISLGAVDYITKPYSAPKLLNIVELRLKKYLASKVKHRW